MDDVLSTQQLRELDYIVAAISNIAHQTNRLALDVAILAAMAGENGKGLGAVAADMRRLTERAKEEAKTLASIARSIREDIAALEEVDEQDTKEQNPVSKQGDSMKPLRLTMELIPDPLQGVDLRNKLLESGKSSVWEKLREQAIAQQNAHCGICQVENVTLNCHEIWHYDDTLHIQKLNGARNKHEWTTDFGAYVHLLPPIVFDSEKVDHPTKTVNRNR